MGEGIRSSLLGEGTTNKEKGDREQVEQSRLDSCRVVHVKGGRKEGVGEKNIRKKKG